MPQLPQSSLVELARSGRGTTGVPASLLYAIMLKESSGNTDAVGDRGRALGLMQMHPAAAEESGYEHSDMLDPNKAVNAAGLYLAQMLGRFSTPEEAVSAYNAGPGRTRAAGGVAPSAKDYVDAVKSEMARATSESGPFVAERKGPYKTDFRDIVRRLSGEPEPYTTEGISQMLSGLFGGQ